MSSDNIVNYLKVGRSRGFGFGVLKEKLLDAGYASEDVSNAVDVLKSHEGVHKKSKKSHTSKKHVKKMVKNTTKVKKRKHTTKAKKVVSKTVAVKVAKTAKRKVKKKVHKIV